MPVAAFLAANATAIGAGAAVLGAGATIYGISEASKRAGRAGDATERQTALAEEQWEDYKKTYRPINEALAKEAMEGIDPNVEAGKASADVTRAFSKAREMEGRELGRYGINPNSGRFVGSNRKSIIDQSVADAGAQTKGRRYAKEMSFARKLDVANMGKGIPSQVSASLYRSGATNAALAGMYGDMAGAGAGAVGRWAGSRSKAPGLGINTDAIDYSSYYSDGDFNDYIDEDPYWADSDDYDYQHGGIVRGPGTGQSDSIQANVSDGEFIIPADVVKKKGTEFFDKLVENNHGYGLRRAS